MMNRFVVYLFGAGSSAHRKETACHTTSPSLCGWRLGAWRGTSYVILPPQRDDYLCRSSSLILEFSSGPFTVVAMIYRLCFNDSGIIVPSLWLATGCMERDVVCHTTAVANLPRFFLPRAAPRGSGRCTLDGKKTCKTEHREPNEANAKGGAQGPQEPCSR